MSMKNFRAEDMPMKVAHAKDSSGKSAATPQQQAAPAAPAANEPPDGTSREVLAWVGSDKERAQAALDKEQANERPRSGLTEDLKQVIDAQGTHTGSDEDAEDEDEDEK